MKKKLILLAIALLLSFSVGCASTKQYVSLPDQTKTIEDPEKGRIYVLRPTSFGGAVSMNVAEGGQSIGNTGANGYLCWERQPGTTEVIGKAENKSKIQLDVEKGAIYYIQQKIQMGILMARNKLVLLDEEKGKQSLAKCKPPKVETIE